MVKTSLRQDNLWQCFLQEGPEKPLNGAGKVKPNLQWRLPYVVNAKAIEYQWTKVAKAWENWHKRKNVSAVIASAELDWQDKSSFAWSFRNWCLLLRILAFVWLSLSCNTRTFLLNGEIYSVSLLGRSK